ncbi:hypothetical protein KAI12_03730 [Candidatus Bathyarchaeota archaeon]|nr:hypothetical protein [Candidatus Bathyarchaeota archaeon]
MNYVISGAKETNEVEDQVVQEKSELLDAMNETIIGSNLLLGEIKDWVCNIRAEVKEVQPLRECLEEMKLELGDVKTNMEKLKEIQLLKNLQQKEDNGHRAFEIIPKTAENLV